MNVNNPRAQVPGYCGYIPGKNSENKFGSTFGQITKNSYPTQPEAFLTTNVTNNAFIQQQYTGDHRFWGDEGKVSAFQAPSKTPTQHNVRVDAPKFKPTPVTNLTYEEVIKSHPK